MVSRKPDYEALWERIAQREMGRKAGDTAIEVKRSQGACRRGHGANFSYLDVSGYHRCRECAQESHRRFEAKRKAAR